MKVILSRLRIQYSIIRWLDNLNNIQIASLLYYSIKSNYGIKAIEGKFERKYYYEVDLKTDYLMQIGF